MSTPISDFDSSFGVEVSGATRKIVVSRDPTSVGIPGIVDIVYPDFPEFTFGSTSSGLLSVAVSGVDSCSGSDSVAARALGSADSSVSADLGVPGAAVSNSDSAAGSESVVGRGIGVADSAAGFDNSTSMTVTGLSGVDSGIGTDVATQSFSVTTLDSSTSAENQNVAFGTSFTGTDSSLLSETQTISVVLSTVDSSTLTDSIRARSLLTTESSVMSEVTGRTIATADSSLGSDFGFVALIQTDSCTTTEQQTSLPAIIGTDSGHFTEINGPIALSTITDWTVGSDNVGARALNGFDASLTTEAIGARTMQAADSSATTDAGIHGNFVFDRQTIQGSDTSNFPVYSPVTTESIHGTDVATPAVSVPSSDSIHLTDNQIFTVLGFESVHMTDSGSPTAVAISATEFIVGTDMISSRVFSVTESIAGTDFAAPLVHIIATEQVHTTDTTLLFAPFTQADRTQGTDVSGSIVAHISTTELITGTDSQVLSVHPRSTDSIHLSENTSIVKTPPNPNAAITVTDVVRGTDHAAIVLVIRSVDASILSGNQTVFRRSAAVDMGTLHSEQQSIQTIIRPTEKIVLSENASVVRASSTVDFIHEIDNEVGSSVDRDPCVLAESESIVDYASLDMTVWAYGEVSMSS